MFRGPGNWAQHFPRPALLGPTVSQARFTGSNSFPGPLYWAQHFPRPALLGPTLSHARFTGPNTFLGPFYCEQHLHRPTLLGSTPSQAHFTGAWLLGPITGPALLPALLVSGVSLPCTHYWTRVTIPALLGTRY